MDTAAKILIVGGVLNLAYGFITGFFMVAIRQQQPVVPKYLTLAHMGPLMQGPMLLSLVIALNLSPLTPAVESAAAILLVAGSICLAAKDTLNWVQSVLDEFRERPTAGVILGALSVITSTIGLIIVMAGVWQGLF